MGAGQRITFVDQYGQGFIQMISNVTGSPPFAGLGIGIPPSYGLHLGFDSAAKPGTNTCTGPLRLSARLKTDIVSFYGWLGRCPAIGPRLLCL